MKTFRKFYLKMEENLKDCLSKFCKSDCLETLEEISVEGKESFYMQVEKTSIYVPLLTDEDRWIEVVKTTLEEEL